MLERWIRRMGLALGELRWPEVDIVHRHTLMKNIVLTQALICAHSP